jgi:3-hydroxybutyryl-CoA dehydrogenase
MKDQGRRAIGIVGGGTMGRGIIQLFAQAGYAVHCYDALPGAAQNAVEFVIGMLRRGIEKGKITQDGLDAVAGRIHPCELLSDLGGCDVVIEAIVENLAIKIELFRALEKWVPETAILATNTSSLLVSAIAGGCARPERVAGLHFFNPVPLMKVAEVIPGVRTNAVTIDTLQDLISGAGHRPVIAADQPGFLVNHVGRGLYTEGLRILEERVAGVADIDALLRDAAGFRMGPFELLDLTGLDVSGKVMESIYEQFQHEPRFRPSSLVGPRIAAGLFGRKSGQGWYEYDGDRKREGQCPIRSSTICSGLRVWIDPAADARAAVAALVESAGATIDADAKNADVLFSLPWGSDATSYCVEHGLDAARCVALDPLPDIGKRRTLMLTMATTPAVRDAAAAALGSDGVPVTLINDSPGFVIQRVLATIVNIAADMAQRGIAAVADIEDAVTLGLGYPHGPLAWGDRIGSHRVHCILKRMQAATGDPRYRPSPWLARRATLGVSLLTPEAVR